MHPRVYPTDAIIIHVYVIYVCCFCIKQRAKSKEEEDCRQSRHQVAFQSRTRGRRERLIGVQAEVNDTRGWVCNTSDC